MSEHHAVVTGGAGFLGSHLVDSLVKDDYEVTVVDNFSSGGRSNLRYSDSSEVAVCEHDVKQPLPEFKAVNEFYHLASRASPTEFESHGVDIGLTNAIGTRNVLEAASEHDATVLLASTSEVYGNPEVSPQSECYNGNVNIRGVRSPYDEGKRFSESLACAYQRERGLDVRTVRIFNTYGPRMRADDGRVIPTFVTRALEGENLPVHGTGEQTRTFCFYSDIISGIREMMRTDDASGTVINLGGTKEITVNRLARIVQDIIGIESEVRHVDRPEDDPDCRKPDIDRARALLDWEPTVDLVEGIEETAAWLDRNTGDQQQESDRKA
ncbi:NAD-dependent epimerase/dehydratase family protein [Halobellus inordinatus]|uniref:NAD-dependent epimerase/dehydratase family protein n=1 Tax=Halobellus inordinatus TaxID=1126236 RepID=UPI002114B356|nr:NAD-dependent epimerase/dehydratase family protein [Halobellus ramosii]